MIDQTKDYKKEIYTIIFVGIIGFFWLLIRLIYNWNWTTTEKDIKKDIAITTNNIIEENIEIKKSCRDSLKILDCIIENSTWDKNAISLYRQKITSERNIIEKDLLEQSCDKQISYFKTLTWTSANCLSSL